MVRSKFVKRSVSVLMAALVVMGGAAAFNGNVSPEVSAAQTSTAQTKATLANQSFLSATAITKGSSVTVYGKMGTTGSVYNYAYYYKKHSSDTWMKIKGYSSTTSVKITPAAATNYDIKVYAKDAKGKIYVKTLYLKVYAPLVNKSTVSKDKIALGSSVTMKGYASGGSGSYEYAYYYKKTGATTWKTLQKYSDSKTATFKPTEKGDYDLMIKVKSPVGGIAKKTYKLNVLNRLVNNSTVSKTVVEKGGTVSVKAAATGGFGGYTYSYSYRAKGETTWKLLKGYSTTTIYKMTMPDAGTYQVLVKAKDSAGNVVSKTLTVTVNVAGLEGKVAAINSTIIKAGMSEYEKVKAIHDWIINNTQYDTIGVITGKVPATSFTAEGLFETHVAVCDGYSKAFEAMAKQAGLSVNRVTGIGYSSTGSEIHAWNQVKVDGKWYNLDVTWDDPTEGNSAGNNLYYNYFLIPDSVMNKDHVAQSTKNTCTAAQPVDKLISGLVELERKDCPKTYLCDTDTKFKLSIQSMSATVSQTYKFIYKTDSSSKVFQMVQDNMPAGDYRLSLSSTEWKINGYFLVEAKVMVN